MPLELIKRDEYEVNMSLLGLKGGQLRLTRMY